MMQRTIQTTRRHHRRRPHLVRHKMAMTFPLNNHRFVATGRRIIDEESSFSRNRRRGQNRGRKRLFARCDDCSDDFKAFRRTSKSRWRNVNGIGKRAKKTLTVVSSSSSSSSWNNEDDGSTTPETTRTRTTTETTTTDMLKRLDEPVVLDWKALVRCFLKAGLASALLLRVWTILTRGGTDAALTAAKSQRWFLLQKWFFSSNQQSLGFGGVVGVVSFALAIAALLVILEKERAERYRLVSAMEARDINSRFADVDGVSVHHKYFTSSSSKEKAEEDDDEESSGVLFSMAHGFGANTYSYEMAFVDKLLEMENANDNNNSVGIVCHDSVGFGLTERPRTDLIKYTKVFNAKCLKAMARKYAGKGKKKKKVVYVGHSLGTIAATLTTTLEGGGDNDTTKPAAIVLIAPAFLVKKEKEQKKTLDGENEEVAKKKPIPKKKIVTPDDEFYDEELFNRVVLSSLKALLGWIKSSLFNLLAKPLLYVLLRTIVRSKQFWRNGLSNVVAKSKASLVDESWIDGYRRPRMVQNWDLGMINFVSASLNDLGADLKAIFRRHMRIYADKPNEYDVSMNPMDALKKSAWEKNIPILIVHGNEDKVVPISNSVNIYNRLITTAPKVEKKKNEMMEIPSRASSSSSSSKLQQQSPPLTKFVVMENTGHCPHEEDPETLASVVRDFLREASVM